MTPKQAAGVIGCTRRTVCSLIASGKLPARKIRTPTNRHGYRYEIQPKDARRIRDTPQLRGRPRKGAK